MENTDHYLVNIKFGDETHESVFFQALKEIDSHPLTVIDKAAYALKSKLGVSEIFTLLSTALTIEDTLLIVPIKDKYEVHSPEFIHWIKFGD